MELKVLNSPTPGWWLWGQAQMHPTGVVILDEDPLIENYLAYLLKRRGYQVVKARSKQAIEMVRSPDFKVLLVITNVPLTLSTVANEVAVLYLAANPDPVIAARFPKCRSVRKPFHANDLFAAVRELTGTVR